MAKNPHELPEDSLGVLDEKGHRIFQHPMAVRGVFRDRRNWTQIVLIVIFMVLPWIKVNGHQAILLNIPDRQFAFFGITFWAHDMPLIFFLLAIATVGLTFVTSIWGRVWCGWACPQTVFIDGLFRRIETWIEGNHLQRIKLQNQPWNKEKILKRTLKWVAFTLVSLHIAHSFAAYFVGADELVKMSLMAPTENWTTFLIVMFIAACVLFDFGWFREQFCIIMCPYGRFQSVLMDEDSLAVVYDEKRGEPRKTKVPEGQTQGDCINCYKCVAACPTGIDIRRGVQMECIACTACIDACDEVMEKIKKPKGLIRYETEHGLKGQKKTLWRARTFIYLLILVIAFSGVVYNVMTKENLHVYLARAIAAPFQLTQKPDGTEVVVNRYNANIRNLNFKSILLNVKLIHPPDSVELIAPGFPLELKTGADSKMPHFFEFDRSLTEKTGTAKIELEYWYELNGKTEILKKLITLTGPHKNGE